MGREFVNGYRDRFDTLLKVWFGPEHIAQIKDLVSLLELEMTVEGKCAAGVKLAASEGEAAERSGVTGRVVDDPLDDLPG